MRIYTNDCDVYKFNETTFLADLNEFIGTVDHIFDVPYIKDIYLTFRVPFTSKIPDSA